jgi:hypothetical protein
MEDCMIEDDREWPEPEVPYDPWGELTEDWLSLILDHEIGRAEWRTGVAADYEPDEVLA